MANSATPIEFSEIDVQTLHQKLQEDTHQLQLIDVREPHEIAIASIPGFKAFPLSQYAVWAETIHHDLDPHQETYVLCHHGMRSAQMCAWLMQQGFTAVTNIAGGIDAYSLKVDPNIPQY